MAWADVRDALKTRLQNAAGVGKVHNFLRWSLAPTDSPAFKDLFADGNQKVNVLIMTRDKAEDLQVYEDNRVLRRYFICIYAYYAHLDDGSTTSELNFQDLLDNIDTVLRNGDRTLGTKCLTYGIPMYSKIGHAALGSRKDSYHCCEIKLEIDEVMNYVR